MSHAIDVRGVSKCYRLGVFNRQSLVDEVRYWWYRMRNKDIRSDFGQIGHTATEQRRVEAEAKGITRFWALNDVSFAVKPGEVVGIIGRNGAGKSTMLKILSQITEPSEGEADMYGRVASLLEVGTGFHPELTGRENVFMNGAILGMTRMEISSKLDEIIDFSGLSAFIDTPVKRYSSGMYVRLAFAVAAHLEPEILLVDEVLAVGDIEFQRKCLGKMQDVSRSGRTILFVSHNMSAVNRLCSRGLLFSDGRLEMDGPVTDVTTAYIAGSGIQDGAREWDEDDAPGSKEVRLLALSLLGADGLPISSLSVHDEATVEIRYRTNMPNLKFRCGITVRLNGVTGFAALEPTAEERCVPGDYISRTRIPAHLLNEGEYTLGVWIFPSVGTKQIKNGYVKENEAVRFQVYDPMDRPSARGDYVKELPGVVRPWLKWETERTD